MTFWLLKLCFVILTQHTLLTARAVLALREKVNAAELFHGEWLCCNGWPESRVRSSVYGYMLHGWISLKIDSETYIMLPLPEVSFFTDFTIATASDVKSHIIDVRIIFASANSMSLVLILNKMISFQHLSFMLLLCGVDYPWPACCSMQHTTFVE